MENTKKQFRIDPQIGRVRYPVSTYDGESHHGDGSPFWGISCFNNKRKMERYIREMKG
jgi:hypothetical protein